MRRTHWVKFKRKILKFKTFFPIIPTIPIIVFIFLIIGITGQIIENSQIKQVKDSISKDSTLENYPQTTIANPASVYCTDLGYQLKINKDEKGEVGVCVFPDESECEEWQFFRNECGAQFAQKIIVPINDSLKNVPFNGWGLIKNSITSAYDEYSHVAINRHPEIVTQVKNIAPDFKVNDMANSFPLYAFLLNDDREFIILSGCSFDKCDDSINIISYDVNNKQAFLLKKEANVPQLAIYGHPDQSVKNLLVYYYFYR